MNKIKFSIIIPAFNVELFIEDCIKSVLIQNFKNWECIIVNDGSVDNTLNIIKEVTGSDNRFIIKNQKNSGPIIARQNAISYSNGEYLLFLDSDDRLVPDALYKLNNFLIKKSPDILFFNLFGDWAGKIRKLSLPYDKDNINMLKLLFNGKLPGWLHSKIIKREYWTKINIKTISDAYVMEDVLITTQLLINKPSTDKIIDYIYIYCRNNDNSLTGKNNGYNITPISMPNLILIEDILKENKILKYLNYEYGKMIMKKKIFYIQSRQLKEGINILPYYHKKIKYYPNNIKSIFYFIIFNLFNFFLLFKKNV